MTPGTAAADGTERRVAASTNAMQRLWLRELGLEKLWPGATMRAPQPAVAEAHPQAPAQEASPNLSSPNLASPNLAHLDLDALCNQVQSCTACGLHAGRKQAVFGTGIAPAAWLIVGEAPGGEEDRQGLPFVGPSGQLLDAMLASVNRSRARDVYIANVVKCRPPGNRNPRPEEITACNGYLMRQIALVNPACILVVGRFAAQTLLNTDAPVSSLRGRVHTLKTDAGRAIPVIVSYHPAYLLRSPIEKARAWADLQLAASVGV